MTTHPKCGKSWGGMRAEHCSVCCETFSGTEAGDRHRRGPHSARYCADPATVGLVQNDKGIWRREHSNRLPAPWAGGDARGAPNPA